jgi:hypothetical protein
MAKLRFSSTKKKEIDKKANVVNTNIIATEKEILNEVDLEEATGLRKEIAAVSTSLSTTVAGTYFGRRVPSSTSLIDRIQSGFMPNTGLEAIEYSFNWYEKDDLLGGVIDLKTEFASLGFAIVAEIDNYAYLEELTKGVSSESEDDEGGEISEDTLKSAMLQVEFNDKLQRICDSFDIASVVETLFRDYFISDSMILYWKTPGGKGTQGEVDANVELSQFDSDVPGLIDISAISPKDVEWDNSLGKDELRVKIPLELTERISIALDQDEKKMSTIMLEGLLKEGVPIKYIEAVKAGDDYVLLSREDGDNWAICTKERKHHGLAKPSMIKIFIPLATRLMMTEGDFAASVMVKHFIFHITSGESITSGTNAGSTKNWATKTETDQLRDLFSSVNKTTIISTNHTVAFKFVYPPIEMFNGDKYISSMQRILNWAAISLVLYSGEGAKYSGGFINLKRVMSNIGFVRSKVVLLFRKMFSSEFIRQAMDVPDGFTVNARFDMLGLKEERQILEELKVLVENNAIGPQTLNRELGRSHQFSRFDRIVASIEDSKYNIWGGSYYTKKEETMVDNTDGNDTNKNGAGRPPNEDTVVSEETRSQDPKPS